MRVLFTLLLLLGSPLAAAADTPFGPTEYVRTGGAPDIFRDEFQACRIDRTFRLIVENGAGGRPPISSGSIRLNDAEVIRERDFNQQVARIERSVRLGPVNRLVVRLASKPGGTLRLTVGGDGGCPDLAFTDPGPGTAVPAGRLVVRGTVRGGREVGVTVNDVPAAVHEERFVAQVSVEAGQTGAAELIAVATTPDGSTVEARTHVRVTSAPDSSLRLHATPGSGAAPLDVRFDLLALIAVEHVTLDLDDGSGVRPSVDLEGQTFRYEHPGIYVPTVTVSGPAGTYQTRVLVQVFDQAVLDALLIPKWGAMKDALRRGDLGGALRYISQSERAKYELLLNSLTRPLAEIDRILTSLSYVSSSGNRAEYQMIRVDDSGDALSYMVVFMIDEDGIWRLEFF